MTYGHYFVTPVLVTPTGLRRLLTLLTHGTLFLLADILAIYQLSLSQARDRTYLTFGSLPFGAKCWAKIPTAQGESKLNPRSVECRLFGYASGSENYKVQDVASRRVFVSRDVVFEEGQPSRTSAGVREETEPLFETDIQSPPAHNGSITDKDHVDQTKHDHVDHEKHDHVDQTKHDHADHHYNTPELRRSSRTTQLSNAIMQSAEYQERESDAKEKGHDWATDKINPKVSIAINHHEDDQNDIACLSDTKTSHHIPRSYKHAMATH